MIRRKCVSPISAFPQGGRWIKGKHGFFIIRTGGSEQAEIPGPARKKLCLRAKSDVQLMHYVYVLRSVRDGGFYIGYSANLRKRFEQHEKGASLATSYRGPWKLI
jgi:hypothetical protein